MKRTENTFDLTGDCGVGFDSNGNSFIFDKEDYPKIKEHYWAVWNKGYAVSRINRKDILLHRFVLNCNDSFQVDHINRNRNDCRKANLRICSIQENLLNKGKYSNNKSGYKGVYFDKSRGKWRAQIRAYGETITLGRYNNPADAYEAYCNAAEIYHSEFRCLA